MESEAAKARYARLHEDRPWHDGTFQNWAASASDAKPYKYDMGVTQGVSHVDLHPDDLFLTVESASPHPKPETKEVPDGDTP